MVIYNVKNVSEYLNVIFKLENQHIAQWFFRGHGDERFKLIPSLFRLDKSDSFSDWQQFEKYMMDSFMRESQPYLPVSPQTEQEWLTVAQHHGLPSRLLDWSANPLVALYFAVENAINEKDGHVWCLGIISTNNCHPVSTVVARRINSEISNCIMLPRHITPRVINQSGCFSVHTNPLKYSEFVPFNEQASIFNKFIKIDIKCEDKSDILNELYLLGVHKGFIYPDLDGLSQKIKYEVSIKHKRVTNPVELKVLLDLKDFN